MRRLRRRRRWKKAALAAAAMAVTAGAAAGYEATRHQPVVHVAEPGKGTPGPNGLLPGPGAGGSTDPGSPGTGSPNVAPSAPPASSAPSSLSSPSSGTSPSNPAGPGSGTASGTVAALTDGSAPVQAQWVVDENRRPGTTGWQISGKTPGFISGFADQTSATAGDRVNLYVSTGASNFSVDAYRMGWYGGGGARLVWTSAPVPGDRQAKCPVQPVTNMVSCTDWQPSLTVPITSEFVPGDYLLKLVGSGGEQSYVPLTVKDPSSHAAYLVENDIYTWQAWNPYGGYDFYQGVGPCPAGGYPVCNRARVVSFDRPYDYGQGAGDFLGNEYPLIRFVEQRGLDVTYATSADFERDPAFMLQHRAVLSLGHDECWSYQERVAAVAAEANGINIIFFGASPMLRHVRLEDSPLGPLRQEIDYRNSASDPLDRTGPAREVTGNTWSDPPADWSEVPFVGEEYTGYVLPDENPVGYRVYDGQSWLFTGTGLGTGDEIPGLLVSDFDQVAPGISPDNVQILAHSPMPRRGVQTFVSKPASDTSYYTDAKSNAGVFDTGTVTWIPDLASNPLVADMTSNLLALFGSGPAGRLQPSVPNWKQLY
jgi:hypothetical protein